MFDIGFPELVLVAIVGLLVIGPERLPEALRTLGLWLGRMRRSFTSVKNEIEKEIGMDEVRRQLHNEAIMEEMKRIESEVRSTTDDVRSTLNETANSIDPTPNANKPPVGDSESEVEKQAGEETDAGVDPAQQVIDKNSDASPADVSTSATDDNQASRAQNG
jgi:sec-independent protein translocase protein TatB